MLTIFTSFGPGRDWLIDFWAANLEAAGFDRAETELVLHNDGADVAKYASLGRLKGWRTIKLLKGAPLVQPFKSRDVSRHLAAIWTRCIPAMSGEYVLSWEPDVKPQIGTLAGWVQRHAALSSVTGCAICNRQHRHLMVYGTSAETGLAECDRMSLGITIYPAWFLRELGRVEGILLRDGKLRSAHDHWLCYAARRNGLRIQADMDYRPRHYNEPGDGLKYEPGVTKRFNKV